MVCKFHSTVTDLYLDANWPKTWQQLAYWPNSPTAMTELHTAFNYSYQIMKNASEQDRKWCHAMHIMLLLFHSVCYVIFSYNTVHGVVISFHNVHDVHYYYSTIWILRATFLPCCVFCVTFIPHRALYITFVPLCVCVCVCCEIPFIPHCLWSAFFFVPCCVCYVVPLSHGIKVPHSAKLHSILCAVCATFTPCPMSLCYIYSTLHVLCII
jgi:hypothetical protein